MCQQSGGVGAQPGGLRTWAGGRSGARAAGAGSSARAPEPADGQWSPTTGTRVRLPHSRMNMATARDGRGWAVVVAGALWLCVTVGWAGALMVERNEVATTFGCPLVPGSSTYGEASWGWLPPGKTCTWTFTESIGDVTQLERTPPAGRVFTAVVLLLWGLTILVLSRSQLIRDRPRPEGVGAITPGW